MNSTNYLDTLKYSELVERVFGEEWKTVQGNDLDGVWGVCIMQSVIEGVRHDLKELTYHLGVPRNVISAAYNRLSLNGCFLKHRLQKDKKNLVQNDILAWCYYAGYASGHTGKACV